MTKFSPEDAGIMREALRRGSFTVQELMTSTGKKGPLIRCFLEIYGDMIRPVQNTKRRSVFDPNHDSEVYAVNPEKQEEILERLGE